MGTNDVKVARRLLEMALSPPAESLRSDSNADYIDTYVDPLLLALPSVFARLTKLEAVTEAVRKECAKFNFPDEDRPELYDALVALDEAQ